MSTTVIHKRASVTAHGTHTTECGHEPAYDHQLPCQTTWHGVTCPDCLAHRDTQLRTDFVNVAVADLGHDVAHVVRIERVHGWPRAGVLVATCPSYTEALNIANCLNDDDDAPVLS